MNCTATNETRTRKLCEHDLEYRVIERKFVCDDGNGPYTEWREESRTATGESC